MGILNGKMRTLKKELDVDFIGSETPLTKDEELAISNFIQRGKQEKKTNVNRTNKNPNNVKETAE